VRPIGFAARTISVSLSTASQPPSAPVSSGPALSRRFWRPLAAASPALLLGGYILFAGEGLMASAWGITLFFAAAVAALATITALGAGELRLQRLAALRQKTASDQAHAAFNRLRADKDQLAAALTIECAFHRAMFAGASHVAILATTADGVITACNPGAERLLGVPAAELIGRIPVLKFHLQSEIDTHRALRPPGFPTTSDLTVWATAAATNSSGTTTWTWQRPDGTTRRVALAVIPHRDHTAHPAGYLAVGEDVTARELADLRLRTLASAGQALLVAPTLADALPGLMQSLAPTFGWEHARVWTAAEAGEKLRVAHAWSAPEAAVAVGSDEEFRTLLDEAAATGEVRHLSADVPSPIIVRRVRYAIPVRLGGSARSVIDTSGRLLAGDPTETGVMLATLAACVSQFLARKEAERGRFEAEGAVNSAVRAKSDFLALMSHEIRTPMNGVIGMSNLLLETNLTPKQRDFAQTIRSSGDSLLSVINDILDFSKMEAGKLPFEHIDFDLRSAIEDTMELMAGNAHAKHLELAAHVHADVPHILHGDPNRLRQVLNNLIANAIKFTAAGEVILTVACEHRASGCVVLRFAIRDTGIGIPPEVQKRLFQPFMQADTSTTRRYGGTGLGLAISKQLVERMHGHIGVVSEEGKGSTFHFHVRLERARHPQLEPGERLLSRDGARALIVDDNAAHARILSQLLKHWGVRPVRAASADAGLRQLQEAEERGEPFAFALLDAELPDAAGTLLARAMNATSNAAGPKLVLMAGLGRQFEDDELRAAGAAAWITRPLREHRLYETLSSVLAGGTGVRPPGTRARFLPVAPVTPAPASRSGGARILLVEDNVINQQIALQLLARMGLSADVAPNGLEALAALRRAPYEVVLMDCMMPEMDGYETTRRIREVERRRAALGIARPQVHIIALTANADPNDRARCLAAGMNEFVAKPVRPDELQRLLERWRESASRKDVAPAGTATAVAG